MEANSLSDIIQLATNPPMYPRKPTEKPRDDLTLYIARVPGSRDIILTTLKPQLKNVTAEDVAASLYYFHLNTEEDKFLQQDSIAEEAEVVTQKPLPRKPLAESARSSLDLQRQSIVPPVALSNTTSPQRKPIPISCQTAQILTPGDHHIPRRPLGPRPPLFDRPSAKKPFPGIENDLLGSASETSHVQLSRNGGNSIQTIDSHAPFDASSAISDAVSFSITIIRRDPTTGSQWNIGSIIGTPLHSDPQSGREASTRRTKKPYFDISVRLTTPGYTTFREPQPPSNRGSQNSSTSQQHIQPSFQNSFDREIYMEGTNFWSRSSMQHRRTRSVVTDNRARNRNSDNSQNVGSPEAGSPRFHEHNNTTGSQSKGYMFISPWGGRCKFSTSSSGRSLKCKHTLPASLSTHITEGISNSTIESVTVSELRFNLPSSAIFTPSISEKNGTGHSIFPKFSHMRDKISTSKEIQQLPVSYSPLNHSEDSASFPPIQNPRASVIQPNIQNTSPHPSRSHPAQTSQVYDEGDAENLARLDLSLGKEKAGGGNRGKRAKLGKLIIHNEGFKMLDLVVSANLGVWWSVWESDDR